MARTGRRFGFGALGVAVLLCSLDTAGAAEPADSCESRKLQAAAKGALCLLKEHAKSALGRTPFFARCSANLGNLFTRAEAAAGPGTCPTESDADAIAARIDAAAEGLAGTLSGVRFLDNGDGTVTDTQTGLMWEKKAEQDGFANANDVHDADNTYTWTAAMSDWLSQLNGRTNVVAPKTPGLAGYSDWRLPNVDELESINEFSNADPSCSPGPCVDPTFGPTAAYFYWTSTGDANFPSAAWYTYFGGGGSGTVPKDRLFHVRAVRGGY
jgi:hypothetical protein